MKKLFANFLLKEKDKELTYTEDSDNFVIECDAATFNVYNENAQNWLPRSFDQCLKEFYGDSLNVVCGIEHKYDGLPIAVFERIQTNGEKMTTTLRIPKSIKFNLDYTIPAIKEPGAIGSCIERNHQSITGLSQGNDSGLDDSRRSFWPVHDMGDKPGCFQGRNHFSEGAASIP